MTVRAWVHNPLVVFTAAAVCLSGCRTREEEPLQPARVSAPSTAAAPAPEPAEDTSESAQPGRLVHVQVYDASGHPAAGARVTIESWRDISGWWHGTADRAGVASIAVPEQATAFRISASLPGYAIVSLQTNFAAPGSGMIECTLRLREPGVTVVAELIGPHAAAITQCFARILPGGPLGWQHVGAAVTSNCHGGRIVFPAIKAGLDNLRVSVEAAGFARAESAAFNTRAGDVTVQVALVDGVALHGRARYADGTPVPGFHLQAEPRLQGDVYTNSGRINQTITTRPDGSFGPLYLLQDFYRLTLTCKDAEWFITNVYLSQDDNLLDVVFTPYRMLAVRGTVMYYEPRGPAQGVTVTWETTLAEKTNVVTDHDGAFVLHARVQGGFPSGALRIAHPGYAPVEYPGHLWRSETPRTIYLYATAAIAGTTRGSDGRAISNVTVHAQRVPDAFRLGNTRRYGDAFAAEMPDMYMPSSRATSDSFGEYVLSNVAAPGTYTVYAQHQHFTQPEANREASVSVKPGAVAAFDITLVPKPLLYVRALDPHGAAQQTFQCGISFSTSRQSFSSSFTVFGRSDDWHEIAFDAPQERTATLEVTATADALRGSTTVTWYADMPPLYVTVPLAARDVQTGECVRGFIYDSSRNPVDDASVSASFVLRPARLAVGHGSARTDPLGYFEIPSLQLVSASLVRFYVTAGGQFAVSNFVCTGAPIEWVLPRQTFVRGRVCIESSATPATSFWVSITGQEPHLIHAPDGRFALPVPPYARVADTRLVARVEGLAPAEVPCSLTSDEDLDLGDIIIRGVPARIRGRVVDENGQPMGAYVTLGAAGVMMTSMNIAQTKEGDGTYEFSEVPPGTYRVVVMSVDAGSLGEAASSSLFDLSPGEDKMLPDLVVMTTNTPLVRFTFLLPDGTPAAHASLPFAPHITDENGVLVARVKCAAYANIPVQIANRRYSADDFIVTPHTRELTVYVRALAELSGTVSLDGVPMQDGYIICTPERGSTTSASVRNGRFALAAQPGRYFVSSGEGAATVTLHAGDDNIIALTRGSATLRINTPAGEKWYTQLMLRFGQGAAPLPAQHERTVYTGLHPGQYTVRAFRVAGASIITNVELHVSLEAGAQRTLAIGTP